MDQPAANPPRSPKQEWTWVRTCEVARTTAHVAYLTIEGSIIGGTFLVILYVGYWIVWGNLSDPRHYRMTTLLETVSGNWKAFFLLLVPLLFRTVRTFLEEVQEAWGMKRQALGTPVGNAKNPTEKKDP